MLDNELQLIEQIKQARQAAVIAISCQCEQDMQGEALAFAFSYQEGSACYFNLRVGATPFEPSFVKKQLNLLLTDPQLRFVAHNYKSSYKVLQRWGLSAHSLFFDTKVAATLLGVNTAALATLVRRYLGAEHDVVGHHSIKNFSLIADKKVCAVAQEVSSILALYNRLAPLLQLYSVDHLFNQQEMPLLNVLAEMELRGICLDTVLLKGLDSQQEKQQRMVQLYPHYSELASGKLTINLPQLANFHNRIDSSLVVRKDFYLLAAVYEQIEWIVLADLSHDPLLCQVLHEGRDLDMQTARLLFAIERDSVSPEQQNIAKVINWGVVHSMATSSLATKLSLSSVEVESLLSIHAEKFSKLHGMIREITTNELGRLETIGGRQWHIRQNKHKAEDAALNFVIQGCVAEIMKKSMIAVAYNLREQGFKTTMLLQLDNTIFFEVLQKERWQVETLLKKTMESVMQLEVPLRVSFKIRTDQES